MKNWKFYLDLVFLFLGMYVAEKGLARRNIFLYWLGVIITVAAAIFALSELVKG